MFGWLRPLQHPLAIVLGQLRDQNRKIGLDVAHILRDLHQLKEQIMADFTGLHGSVDELKRTVAETAERIERRLDEVLDDTVDQAATDQAAAEIREATAALKAIAPDQPAEPTNPADNPNEPTQP